MKRKLFTILVIVLLLSLTVTIFAGCDKIFSKNETRDANQVVAKISYKNQVSTITKAQLSSSFNAYAYSYVNYYSMTYEQAASYILSSLAQRELLVLYVKDRIADIEALGDPANLELRKFISNLEYVDAVDAVNKDMQSSLESVIKELIEEDKSNAGEKETIDTGVYEHAKITNANKDNVIRVFFDSDGGSDVDSQKILKGEAADRPTNPTKDGYTFIGWYVVNNNVVSDSLYTFGADAKVEANLYLQAKWTKYLAPRTEKAKEEEEDKEYDYSKYATEAEIKAAVSDAEAAAKLKFFDADYAATAKADAQENLEITDEEINKYFDKGMKQLKDKLEASYLGYDYYLNSEFKTLILSKYQRLLGYDVEVLSDEVIAEYNRIAANNIEVYGNSDSAYETAIKGTLADAIYQNFAWDTVSDNQDCYGFVINILLKLNDDEVKVLTQMASDGTYSKEQLIAKRNELLNAHMVPVSNPDYSSEAECDHYTKELDNYVTYDAQTDFNHQCTCLDADHKYDEYNKDNNFNQMIEFKYNDTDACWEIVYNVHECPTMAYLSDTADEGNILYWPAMSDGTKTGIVEQIYNSYKQIDAAVAGGTLTHVESVYWYREMAKAWLYLVGDDAGGTSSDSNNGGLGYLVSSKDSSVESSYIPSFTDFARGLINKGAGSYSLDGSLDNSYIFADSFIDNGGTSGYAGIFMLMTTYSAYDASTYTFETETGVKSDVEAAIALDMTQRANKLPANYVVTYDKDLDNCKTIYDVIYDKLLSGKKYEKYSLEVNKFGEGAINDNITYYEKNYESLWKKLDKGK